MVGGPVAEECAGAVDSLQEQEEEGHELQEAQKREHMETVEQPGHPTGPEPRAEYGLL